MPQFPSVDPIPVPAPIWLIKLLHDLTFALHLTSVGLLIGGLILGLVFAVFGRMRNSSDMTQAAGMIAHRLPTLMAFVINLGIPPLLFAQVLYGRALYTSSVLMGAYWISVIFLLMGSYFGLYMAARRADSQRPWTAPAFASLLLVLAIAFIYSNNMTLMLHPQGWASMYSASPSGVQLNTGDPTLLTRWLFMIAGAFSVTGAALIVLALRSGLTEGVARLLRLWGTFAIVIGVVDQAAFARLSIAALPEGVFSDVMKEPLYSPFVYGWVATAALLLVLGAMALAGRSALVAVGAGLIAFLNVASTVMVRDGIRDVTLRAAGFDVWNRQVATNWSVLGLFLLLFVAALAVIGYLIVVVAKARRIEEKYA